MTLRAAVALFTLVAVFALEDRPLALSALAVGGGVLVAMFVDERLVIPIIALLMPLEIGARLIPLFGTENTARLGASALNLARIGVMAGSLLWALRAPRDWWGQLPRTALYTPLVLLLTLYLLSLANTGDLNGGLREVARLALHLTLLMIVPLYVRDRQTLRWVLLAIIASGAAVALIGIYQEVTDSYLWNEDFLRRIGGRRNATFVNSSYFARFLAIIIVTTAALAFRERGRMQRAFACAFALAVLAIPFTASRSNWAAVGVLLPLVFLLLPLRARLKARLLLLTIVGGVTLIGLMAVADSALAARFSSVGSDWEGRTYLIRGAWQIFLDHPVFGIGLDGFEEAMQGPYNYLTPGPGSVIRSHTAVLTMMAELGIAGLAVLTLLLYRFFRLCRRIYRESSAGDRTLIVALGGAFLAIFINSFFAEALLEDPYTWLIMGLVLALSGIRRNEARPAGWETGAPA